MSSSGRPHEWSPARTQAGKVNVVRDKFGSNAAQAYDLLPGDAHEQRSDLGAPCRYVDEGAQTEEDRQLTLHPACP